MPTVEPFPAGGYRFIVHQFQYSGGVAAEPGFRIERALRETCAYRLCHPNVVPMKTAEPRD